MVVKVSGKIDGKEVIFERAEGDRWNVTVPYDLDGMYEEYESGTGKLYQSNFYSSICFPVSASWKFLPVNGAMETTERIVYQLPGMTTIRFRIS